MFNSAAMFLGGRRCSSQLEIPTLYLKTDDEDDEREIGSISTRSRRTSFESSHHHRIRHSLPLASLTRTYQHHSHHHPHSSSSHHHHHKQSSSHYPVHHYSHHPYHTHQQIRHQQQQHQQQQQRRPSNLEAITPSTPSTAVAISPESPTASSGGPGGNPTPTSTTASFVPSGTGGGESNCGGGDDASYSKYHQHPRYEKHYQADHHRHNKRLQHNQYRAPPPSSRHSKSSKTADIRLSMGPSAYPSMAAGPALIPMAGSVTTAAALLHSSALIDIDNTPTTVCSGGGTSNPYSKSRRSSSVSKSGGGSGNSFAFATSAAAARRKSQMYELPILNPLHEFDDNFSPFANCTAAAVKRQQQQQQTSFDSGILESRVAPSLPYLEHQHRIARYSTRT